MIEIYHLIYWRDGGNKPPYGRITYRKNWDFKNCTQKKERVNIWLPYPFQELVSYKYDLYFYVPSIRESKKFLEFTIGLDKESSVYSIAITYPNDNFNKKIGCAIVEGRIKRMKGEIEGREPYDLNEFFLVYKEE